MTDYLSVSSLTKYLKLKFNKDPYLERVYVTGQVSNFRRRPNHQYFSLKDENAVIKATMWAKDFKTLGFELEEGMKINVVGRIDLYEPNGSYSIIIERADPDGVGVLALRFEQLKEKLAKAGYFEDTHKRPLPRFPKKIGVITSVSGAVIRDIITTVSRRFSGVSIVLFPTKVQGDGSSQEIVANIKRANQLKDLDVLIVGRGGGTIEDLWAFNEESVVEAIFESHLPVISSVGHETDTTLSDFVADRRAATPTAAAELATPVTKADVLAFLSESRQRSYQATLARIETLEERLAKSRQSVIFRQPERLYDSYVQKIDYLCTEMTSNMRHIYSHNKQKAELLEQRLLGLELMGKIQKNQTTLAYLKRLLLTTMTNQYDSKLARFERVQDALLSLDTSHIVARGYAIVKQNGQILSSVEALEKSSLLQIVMRDGQLEVEVEHVKKSNI
ncbi:exodeoxyribonuclease VII large subunit [Streptococcus sciuri]|uniref:Exodeoxyribonuclease 7 large subunit n=1 Tax=Streptococcus sciuri TaxID=2973939 RepID=A0ABT2F6N2_9STRE|nr:exodeoxyribonuclease VII large subunit [Streptococcus sciuri]MCS4488084.1 exodeoxyribonuclease VII large subunit [Streptococcus sciuri]